MKKMLSVLAVALLALGGCYKGVPACKPGTVDYPRCEDVTQPKMGSSLLYPSARILNSGTTGGRLGVDVLIDRSALAAATTYSTASWTGGLYRELHFKIIGTSGTATGISMTLTGLSGTYKSSFVYNNSPSWTVGGYGSDTTWFAGGYAAPSFMRGAVEIQIGAIRFIEFSAHFPDGGGAGVQQNLAGSGANSDTTNQVTRLNLAWSGGNFTGTVEVWGVPS